MKKMTIISRLRSMVAAVVAVAAMSVVCSCDDSTSTAGGSLVQNSVEIIMDSTFTVTGRSVPFTEVPARTTMQLLGRLKADGFGNMTSDVVTQYMPSASVETKYVKPEYIDSVKMIMAIYADGFTGDSAVPMGITVHPLTTQLPSGITSSFDPTGYYDPSVVWGYTTFSTLIKGAKLTAADSNGNLYKNITVDLPVELGRDLYKQYVEHPETFSTPASFAEWFPGLYITSTFGSGRITRIDRNVISVYYHRVLPPEVTGLAVDSIEPRTATYMGVTPEIVTNNNISLSLSQELTSKVTADGKQLVVAPLGYDVEFTFPARDIVAKYKAQAGDLAVINSLSFSLPAEPVKNDFGITPPPYLLMVKKSDREKFFFESQVNDNVTSFYAVYNTATRAYDFSSMRDYILSLLAKDEITDEDCDFVLTPVLVAFYENTTSSSYSYYYYSAASTTRIVAQISPYVTEPVMAELLFDKAKIKFAFSRQSIKN